MNINQRVTPSQVERSSGIKIGDNRGVQAPTGTQPPVTSNPQAFARHSEQTQTPIQSETEVHEIQQGVKQSSPQTMLSESEGLPQPKSLQTMLQEKAGQLKQTEISDRSGLLESTKAQYLSDASKDQAGLKDTTISSQDVERVTREVSLAPLTDQAKGPVQQFNQAYIKYAQSGLTEAYLAEQLTGALKDLDKADTLIGGDKHIAKSNQRTQAQVKAMIAGLSSQLNLSVHLATQSDDQLRQIIMSAIGQSKGYDLAQTANLSKKKMLFVEAVLKGIKQGLPEQSISGTDIKGNPVPEGHGGELFKALPQNSAEIRARIQSVIAGHGPDSDLSWHLTMKSEQDLGKELEQALGGKVSPGYVKSLVETINQSLPNRLSTKMVDLGAKHGAMPETLTLGDKTYGTPTYLAEGGFGKIFTYTNHAAPFDKVVVKQAIADKMPPDELRKLTVDEITAHREILGAGHDNIIGLKGAVKSKDDQLYIVMEHASGGNLYGASEKLQSSLDSGLISADTRNLLGKFLLRGVLEGTRHMQETTQAHHGDFKTPNILISGDGTVKLTDFGNSGIGLTRNMTSRMVDNPMWLSPEYVQADLSVYKFREQSHAYRAVYQENAQAIDHAFASIKDRDFRQKVEAAIVKQTIAKLEFAYPEIHAEVTAGLKQPAEQLARLQALHPGLAESMLPQVKLYLIHNVVDHLVKKQGYDDSQINPTVLISGDLERHYNADDNKPKGTDYKRFAEIGAASQQGRGQDMDIAKVDTWATGIVATELLLSSHSNTQIGDFSYAHKLHYHKTAFMSDVEASLKALAADDKRLMAGAQDLNLQTLASSRNASIQEMATAYAQDPRFSGPAHLQMFDVLTKPQPPMGPKDDSSQALAEYQQASAQYKQAHGLDDQGLAKAQENYSQALQQFKAVLQTEIGVGVTAQDRLINGLTHPDPSKRITMEAALKNSVFDDPRLDMPETRQLWQALNTNPPDANKIKELVGSLGQ